MIEIKGEICYSPYPPERYGKGPLGHGPFCHGDIQQWNLIFISCGMVDRYLDPKVDVIALANAIPDHILGDSIAALRGANCIQLFPTLREALRLPPMQFIHEVMGMKHHALPMVLSDPNWITNIQHRAVEISGEAEGHSWVATRKLFDVLLRGGNIVRDKPGE
jgi:hypothetical protein